MERDLKIRSQDVIWIDSNEMADMEGESEKFLKRLEHCTACVKHRVKMDTQEFDPRLVVRNSVRMKTGEERKEEHAGTIKERSL